MEYTANLTVLNFPAGEIIPVGRVCYLKSDGKLYMCDSGAKPPIFVAREAAAAIGDRIDVGTSFPVIEMEAGGNINIGSNVECTTDGKVIAVTTNDNAWVTGAALKGAASGDLIPVLYNPHVTNDASALNAD